MTVRARFAILAHAPVLYNRISFVPPLPRLQHQMHQHISMGFVIKVHAVYDRPFWREQGLSRHRVQPLRDRRTRRTTTPTTATSAARSSASSRTSNADDVFELSAEERKERILESLSHYYGARGEEPGRVLRERLGQRGVDARRVRRELRHRRPAPLRRRPAHPGRTDPLRLQRHRRRRLPARRRRHPHGAPRRIRHHRSEPRPRARSAA